MNIEYVYKYTLSGKVKIGIINHKNKVITRILPYNGKLSFWSMFILKNKANKLKYILI